MLGKSYGRASRLMDPEKFVCAYNPVAVYFFDATTRLLVDSAFISLTDELVGIVLNLCPFSLFSRMLSNFNISREIKVILVQEHLPLYIPVIIN